MRSEKEVLDIFSNELNSFETVGTKIREFTLEIMQYMPGYFLEKINGLDNKIVIHTKSCMVIANELFRLECFREKFTASERDCIRSALLLHDAMVFGNGQTEEFAHPEYVATYLSSDKWEEKLPDFIRKDIAGMIASHSGQWNVGDDNFHLRKPETECQIFVHMIVHIVESDECTTSLPVVATAYERLYNLKYSRED